MNKVTLTINSRLYTVVASESEEYIVALGNHVNEKIENVLHSGSNIIGERPLVLAALNICDEYFKAKNNGNLTSENYTYKLNALTNDNAKLKQTISDLKKELDIAKGAQVSLDETENKAMVVDLQNKLFDADAKIKFLEGQLTVMENRQKEMKQEFAAREQEMLNLFNKQ